MSDHKKKLEARVDRLERALNGPTFRLIKFTDRVLRRIKKLVLGGEVSALRETRRKREPVSARQLSQPAASSASSSPGASVDVAVAPIVELKAEAGANLSRTSRRGTPAIPAVDYQSSPRVSVVMTTFNAAGTVEEAIWSLLNQSYATSEIVVADDLSTDATRDIVARMAATDPRIRLICMAQNRGTFWAKNVGLTLITGDVVTFMDSDDISMPTRIEMQLRGLARKGTVASLCACVRVAESGEVVMNRGLRSRTAPVSLMFHRSILRDVGYFDSVRTSADSEFQERLKTIYGRRAIHQIPEPLYVARVREGSLSNDPLNPVSLSGDGAVFLSPARQAYQSGFTAWHQAETEAGRRPYVSFPVSERPFPADGPLRISDEPEEATSISAFMATYPPRLENLRTVIPAIVGQVDRLYVYLNEFEEVPDILKHDRIFPKLGGDRNLRDAGKFFFADSAPKGYWVFVDDDIDYPEDYCDVLVRAIESHRRKSVVGVHGVVLSRPLDRYFSDHREVYRFHDAAQERRVNLIGSGTAAMHSSLFDIDDSALNSASMADIWLGIKAKRSNAPMRIVRREKGWLKPIAPRSGRATLYDEYVNRDEEQTALLRAEGDWTIPVDRLMDGARG